MISTSIILRASLALVFLTFRLKCEIVERSAVASTTHTNDHRLRNTAHFKTNVNKGHTRQIVRAKPTYTVTSDPPMRTVTSDPRLRNNGDFNNKLNTEQQSHNVNPKPTHTVSSDPPMRTVTSDPRLRNTGDFKTKLNTEQQSHNAHSKPTQPVSSDPPMHPVASDPPMRAVTNDPPMRAVANDPPMRAVTNDPRSRNTGDFKTKLNTEQQIHTKQIVRSKPVDTVTTDPRVRNTGHSKTNQNTEQRGRTKQTVRPKPARPPTQRSRANPRKSKSPENVVSYVLPPIPEEFWKYDYQFENYENITKPCTADEFQFGRWIPGAHRCGLSAQYEHDLASISRKHAPSNPLPIPYPFADWCWQPATCKAELFSIEDFCRKLGGRWVLLVGDSITYEMYVALFMQLRSRPEDFRPTSGQAQDLAAKNGSICTDTPYPSKLVFVDNAQMAMPEDTLAPNTVMPPGVRDYRDWSSIAHHFGVVVVNRGAHYRKLDVVKSFAQKTVAFLQRYLAYDTDADRVERNRTNETVPQQRRQVIFRNTPQGSPRCSLQSQPNVSTISPFSPPKYLECRGLDPRYCRDWHWDTFPSSDALVIDMLRKALPKDSFSVLHAAEMSTLRPDGHRCTYYIESKRHRVMDPNTGQEREVTREQAKHVCDEFHHFLPSVVDTWVQVLHNLLI